MLKTDINGTIVEAETLKGLNRLIKKELKKQEILRKAEYERSHRAQHQAYAALGKLTTIRLKHDNFLPNPSECSFLYQNHSLFIESLNGEEATVELSPQEEPITMVLDAQGFMLAVKIRYTYQSDTRPPETEDRWHTYGADQGGHFVITLPAFIADYLESVQPQQSPESISQP